MVSTDLEARVQRLERQNRWLIRICGLLAVFPVLAAVGWQSTAPSVVRAQRLEIVDDHGVPLVTLSADRDNAGGLVLLRDKNGEKRAWMQADPGSASVTLLGGDPDDPKGTTVGLNAAPQSSQMSLISGAGASFTAEMTHDQPRLELWNAKGQSLFAAPWKPAK